MPTNNMSTQPTIPPSLSLSLSLSLFLLRPPNRQTPPLYRPLPHHQPKRRPQPNPLVSLLVTPIALSLLYTRTITPTAANTRIWILTS